MRQAGPRGVILDAGNEADRAADHAGWRGWAEVVWSDLRSPEYIGYMPHASIGAEFSTAIRRILLRESGGALELLHAVPDAWWVGEGISLRDLP